MANLAVHAHMEDCACITRHDRPNVPHMSRPFDTKAKRVYLNTYREHGLHGMAAKAAGVSRQCVEQHLEKDEGFKAERVRALADYRETIEHEIKRRAMEGWDEPVFYKGNEVGVVHKYSDRMLELHGKRHIPEYRDKQSIDLNATGGILVVPGTSMTAEEWEKHTRKEGKPCSKKKT